MCQLPFKYLLHLHLLTWTLNEVFLLQLVLIDTVPPSEGKIKEYHDPHLKPIIEKLAKELTLTDFVLALRCPPVLCLLTRLRHTLSKVPANSLTIN